MGRPNGPGAVAGKVTVPKIVRQDQDDVRSRLRGMSLDRFQVPAMLLLANVRIATGGPECHRNESQDSTDRQGDQDQTNSKQNGSQRDSRERLVRATGPASRRSGTSADQSKLQRNRQEGRHWGARGRSLMGRPQSEGRPGGVGGTDGGPRSGITPFDGGGRRHTSFVARTQTEHRSRDGAVPREGSDPAAGAVGGPVSFHLLRECPVPASATSRWPAPLDAGRNAN